MSFCSYASLVDAGELSDISATGNWFKKIFVDVTCKVDNPGSYSKTAFKDIANDILMTTNWRSDME